MQSFDPAEIQARHQRLQELMKASAADLDAVIVLNTADLYYLSASVQTAHLLITPGQDPRLLVRKVLERAREDSPLEHIEPLTSIKLLPERITELCGPPPWRIGMELDVVPAATFAFYSKLLGENTEIVDASGLLLKNRASKSDYEIEELRRAAGAQRLVFEAVPEFLSREGISTYELQNQLDCRARSLGHCGVIRLRGMNIGTGIGIVTSGAEGALPNHSHFPIGGRGPHVCVSQGGSPSPIEADTPIIVDYLMSLGGYHSDCTRMAVRGTMPDGAVEIYEKTRELLRFSEETIRAGSIPSKIYEEMVALARDKGIGDNFMGPGSLAVKFTGHSVGLEVNEAPVLAPRFDEPLVEGNTLAIEPKYTHPDWGVIGVENTYAVRKDRLENLTEIPEDIISVAG
ncbi:MAG: M24 family metallopeptidase [Planctomycetota bacterium]|nr:M24 family metallopeptidase [Planctomycetota bacterium]